MIRIVALPGSPVKEGNTEAVLEEALRAAGREPEVHTEIFDLSGLEIAGCRHCDWCLENQTPDKVWSCPTAWSEIYLPGAGGRDRPGDSVHSGGSAE